MASKKDAIKKLIGAGADIAGSAAGGVVGFLMAGPAGAAMGGAAGPLLSRTFKTIGEEIDRRVIGPREEVRIGAAYTFAIQKLQENLSSGNSQKREDAFFEESRAGRAAAEEILEGIVLTAQREYEERKVAFLGYLYANICTNASVTREHANQLIKTASNLSFRQFCLLAALKVRRDREESFTFRLSFALDNASIQKQDVIAELRDLHQRGLVTLKLETIDSGIDDHTSPIDKQGINISSSGLEFYDLLSLDRLALDDLAPILQFMSTEDRDSTFP